VSEIGSGLANFEIVRSTAGVLVGVTVLVLVEVTVGVFVAAGVFVLVFVGVSCVQPITVNENAELLFAVLISGIVLFGFTTAVFVIGEFTTHGLSISATIWIVAEAPTGIVPPVQATTLPDAPHTNPRFGLLASAADRNVRPAGRLSCTVTPTAFVPPTFVTCSENVTVPPAFAGFGFPLFTIVRSTGSGVGVIVGVEVVVDVNVSTGVFVTVAVLVAVPVAVLVFATVVFVAVGLPGVFVLVGVFVGAAPGVPLTFDENPGKPHKMCEAPMIVPCAFSASTTPQISPPFPGSVTVLPVVPTTPSVPTPHTMKLEAPGVGSHVTVRFGPWFSWARAFTGTVPCATPNMMHIRSELAAAVPFAASAISR
jgi:hypothetical protein